MQVWPTRQSCHTGRSFPQARQKSGNSVRQQLHREHRESDQQQDSSDGNAWFPARQQTDSGPSIPLQHAWCKKSSSPLSIRADHAHRWCCGGLSSSKSSSRCRRASRRSCRGDEKSPSSEFYTPAAQWEEKNGTGSMFREPAVKEKIQRLGQLQAPVAFARQQRLRPRWAVV